MFNHSSASNPTESTLVIKKRAYQEQIRKIQKGQIFRELREQALMPQEIIQCINALPNSIDRLIQLLGEDSKIPLSWYRAISTALFTTIKENSSFLNNCPPNMQIPILILVISNQNLTEMEFESIWLSIEKDSLNWSPQLRCKLLRIIRGAMEYINPEYILNAQPILEQNLNRFNEQTLDFYEFLLTNYCEQSFKYNILSIDLFQMIADRLKIQFYSTSQKILMLNLLIQILYLSEQDIISSKWLISKLFHVLEFFIGSSNSNSLIYKSIILIYNINIDASSKIFMTHVVADRIRDQMCNPDHPQKVRQLMAETYLSALINFPPMYLGKYIINKSQVLSDTLQMIAQEFKDSRGIMSNLEEVLSVLLNISSSEEVLVFRKWMMGHVQLMEAVRYCPFGQKLLQQWDLL